jgi:hypothetical protein
MSLGVDDSAVIFVLMFKAAIIGRMYIVPRGRLISGEIPDLNSMRTDLLHIIEADVCPS